MRGSLFLALLIGLGAPRELRAERCEPLGWRAIAGTVSEGARCGSVVITTDAAGARPVGRASVIGEVDGDGSFVVTVQALTAGAGPVHVELGGVYVMVRDGQIGFYESEAQWSLAGWQPMPAPLDQRRLADGVTIAVERRGAELIAVVDGVEAGRWRATAAARRANPAVWVYGPRGGRARLAVRDAAITDR